MKSNYDILGNHIRLIDIRNKDNITDRVLGINIDKYFMPSVANVIGTDLSKYKLITKGKFACNPMHVGRFFLGDKPLEKAPFLFSTLLYGRVSRHLQPDGTAGSAQDNLSADNIKDVAIVVPDTKVIESFNSTHQNHLKSIMLNNAEIRTLSKLQDIMLAQISGR